MHGTDLVTCVSRLLQIKSTAWGSRSGSFFCCCHRKWFQSHQESFVKLNCSILFLCDSFWSCTPWQSWGNALYLDDREISKDAPVMLCLGSRLSFSAIGNGNPNFLIFSVSFRNYWRLLELAGRSSAIELESVLFWESAWPTCFLCLYNRHCTSWLHNNIV